MPRGIPATGPPRPRRRALRATFAAGLLAVGLAACAQPDGGGGVASLSGEGGGPTETTAAPNAKDFEQARIDWAECMRENGVDVPDPGSDGRVTIQRRPGDGRGEEDFDKAQKACEHLMQGFAPRGGRMPEEARERVLAMAQCLRDHGFDVPDPQFEGGGARVRQTLPKGIDPESQEFQDAQRECAEQTGMDDMLKGAVPAGPGGQPAKSP